MRQRAASHGLIYLSIAERRELRRLALHAGLVSEAREAANS